MPSLESTVSASTIHRRILAERSQDGPGCQTTGGILNALIAWNVFSFSFLKFMRHFNIFQHISTYSNIFQHGFHDLPAEDLGGSLPGDDDPVEFQELGTGLLKCIQCSLEDSTLDR